MTVGQKHRTRRTTSTGFWDCDVQSSLGSVGFTFEPYYLVLPLHNRLAANDSWYSPSGFFTIIDYLLSLSGTEVSPFVGEQWRTTTDGTYLRKLVG